MVLFASAFLISQSVGVGVNTVVTAYVICHLSVTAGEAWSKRQQTGLPVHTPIPVSVQHAAPVSLFDRVNIGFG